MAIYHFSAKVISRGSGAMACVACHSASRLHDERLDRHHGFSNKAGVIRSEVMLPDGAPERLADRTTLCSEVAATEKRKDAQLARAVKFAIPHEITKERDSALAREFAQHEFGTRGMVADLNVHWDIGADGQADPHAHANARLQSLGIEARIDHRSCEAQGIGLKPQHKVGAARARRLERGEEAERADEHRAIASSKGATIVGPSRDRAGCADPHPGDVHRPRSGDVRAPALGRQGAVDQVLAAMRSSDALLALGRGGQGSERFTTVAMLSVEKALTRNAAALASARHGIDNRDVATALASTEKRGMALGAGQCMALDHVTSRSGLSLVVG